VQRVADSVEFRTAPRLREFLLFITDMALSGRASDISEQRIGHEVFHRAPDYDTANDNIVRVSARQLRIKLKEYTERKAAEAWTIEVPKGGYVPVFTTRQVDHEIPVPPANVESLPAALRRWKIAPDVRSSGRPGAGAYLNSRFAWTSRAAAQSPLTDLIVRPGSDRCRDGGFFDGLAHELTGQLTTADDYAMRAPPPLPKDASLNVLTRSIASQQLTSVADVEFAVRLLRIGRMRPTALPWFTRAMSVLQP